MEGKRGRGKPRIMMLHDMSNSLFRQSNFSSIYVVFSKSMSEKIKNFMFSYVFLCKESKILLKILLYNTLKLVLKT